MAKGEGDPQRDLDGALHDVSNALTVLLGWVAEARAAGASQESVAYALRIVDQRARVARDLARRAIGGPRLDAEGSLDQIVREIVDSLAVEAQRAGVLLSRAGEASCRVLAGADVEHVLTNLVMNAIAYAPRGTQVSVRAESDREHAIITVSDEGPGVPASRRDSVFQGDSTREGGVGIGLRHARAIARKMGGELALDTTASKGAVFRLVWPRADGVPRPPVSVARLQLFDGQRVLIVEDDLAVTGLLDAALTARGANVTIAHDVTELGIALAEGAPHAVLLDLSPLAGDLAGAVARIRKAAPSAELVVITGRADALPAEIGSENARVVRKPFELGEIVIALSDALKPKK